jgi:hypothetical protein
VAGRKDKAGATRMVGELDSTVSAWLQMLLSEPARRSATHLPTAVRYGLESITFRN